MLNVSSDEIETRFPVNLSESKDVVPPPQLTLQLSDDFVSGLVYLKCCIQHPDHIGPKRTCRHFSGMV